MARYQNGRIPLSDLIQLDSGSKHWSTPHTAALWYALRANVQRKYGVTLHITPGWNAYRPYDQQVEGRKSACAQGNCLAAADPGTSSHGGTWWDWRVGRTVDAMAIDIGDWWQLKQATFYAECEAVGLSPGLITKAVAGRTEEWHVIDLAPFAAVPAGLDSHPLEEDMPLTSDDIAKIAAAVWQMQIHYSTGGKSVIQALADVPQTVAQAVWAQPVNRSSGPVSALQELADAKTAGILLQAQVAALSDALARVAAGSGLTSADIRAAAEAGAQKALTGLTLVAKA